MNKTQMTLQANTFTKTEDWKPNTLQAKNYTSTEEPKQITLQANIKGRHR